VTVRRASPTQSIPLPGAARGWYESTIYARVSGYVDQWYVDIGDRVTKGQVLATIETPDLDAQLQAAQHQLAMSQSEVEVAKANAEFAKTTYERWKEAKQGVVSEQEREEKKAEFNTGMARVQAALFEKILPNPPFTRSGRVRSGAARKRRHPHRRHAQNRRLQHRPTRNLLHSVCFVKSKAGTESLKLTAES